MIIGSERGTEGKRGRQFDSLYWTAEKFFMPKGSETTEIFVKIGRQR